MNVFFFPHYSAGQNPRRVSSSHPHRRTALATSSRLPLLLATCSFIPPPHCQSPSSSPSFLPPISLTYTPLFSPQLDHFGRPIFVSTTSPLRLPYLTLTSSFLSQFTLLTPHPRNPSPGPALCHSPAGKSFVPHSHTSRRADLCLLDKLASLVNCHLHPFLRLPPYCLLPQSTPHTPHQPSLHQH